MYDFKLQCSNTVVSEPYTRSGFISVLFLCDPQEGVFQGLIPILNCYLENMEVDVDTRCTILNYLKLIKKRASGKFAFFVAATKR